jgi:uncharacterized protein YceH (UPF0502 family)
MDGVVQSVLVPVAVTTVALLVAAGGRLLIRYVRREGAADLRRVDLDRETQFRDDLMEALDKSKAEAARAWERAQMAESDAMKAQREVWTLKARVEALEDRVASLETENAELRAELGGH